MRGRFRRFIHLDDALLSRSVTWVYTQARGLFRTPWLPLVTVVAALLMPETAAAALKVQITGVSGPVRENVEARLSLLRAVKESEADPALLRRLHRRADGEIREALQAVGYYNPQISTELQGEPPNWRSVIQIRPGPATRIRNLDVVIEGDGAAFSALQRARDELPVKPGQVLRHAQYEASKSALLQAAYRGGYLDAELSRRWLLIDPKTDSADIELTLQTGPRYTFGPLTLEQEILDEGFLRRYIDIEPGAAFDPSRLNQARFALTDLGYFSSLEVQARRSDAEDGAIPVLIRAEAAPAARYRVGAGYGTDTGARLGLGADFRRVNRQGHRLESDLRVSEVADRLQANYRIPLGETIGEQLSFSAEYADEVVAALDTRRLAVGTALDRSPGDWERKLYLRFEREDFSSQTETGSSKLLIPGLSLSRTRIDDPVRARQGWSVFGDVHGAARGILSDNGFLQGRLQARVVWPLGERSRILLRGEAGGTLVEEFSQLPPSQRFFAGGDQSIRGYAYQSVGPTNAAGEVIGGEFLRTASLELETRIVGNWGAAVFLDAGGADDDPNTPIRRGVGAGARWIAPIGTLQVDLAHPLDGERRGVRLHIGIRVGL